jgi:heme exporter protein B
VRARERRDRAFAVTALRVLAKDLKLHARDARFLATLALFSLSLVLILSVAFGPLFRDSAREASATLWAALFFAGVLGLTRALDLESESGGGEALRLTGADPFAIYTGKTAANFLLMAALFALVLPCSAVFFDVGNLAVLPAVAGVAALALIGYAAWGTLFAALARGAKARELLLSILLFPTLIPLWIGAVKLTRSLWAEGSIDAVRDWVKIMVVMDVMGLALAAWLQEAEE